MLAGGHYLLQHVRPAIVLEIHNQDAYRACVDLLKGSGYTIRKISGRHLRVLDAEAAAYARWRGARTSSALPNFMA